MNTVILMDLAHVTEFVNRVRASRISWLAYDTETIGTPGPLMKKAALILHRARICLYAFYHPEIGSAVIPTHYLNDKCPSANQVADILRPMMESIPLVMHNANYDISVTRNHGIDIAKANFEDTLLLAFNYNENAPKSLKELCQMVNMMLYETKTVDFTQLKDLAEYGAADVEATGRLFQVFTSGAFADGASKVEIARPGYQLADRDYNFYKNQDIQVLRAVIDAETRGVKIDRDHFADLARRMKERIRELTLQIYEQSGMEFNISSTQQLCTVLYDHLKLPVLERTQEGRGQPSTNELTLNRLYERTQHSVIKGLLDYRVVKKLLGTYVNESTGIPAMADKDGILHCTQNICGAVTTRFSVQFPALQTIPKEDEWKIRDGFVARDGYEFLDVDYDQMELRLVALFSQDQQLLNVFARGEDPHTATGRLCGVGRSEGKTCNFLLVYNGSARRLASQLTQYGHPTSLERARELRGLFFSAYPGILPFWDIVFEAHRKHGYVTYINGRRRSVPDMNSLHDRLRASAERRCANNLIQGSGAQWIREATIRFVRPEHEFSQLGGRFLLNIHDEALCEAPKGSVFKARQALQYELEQPTSVTTIPLPISLTTEAKHGTRWGSLSKFTKAAFLAA